MNITKHFDIAEFHCKDGTHYPLGWVAERLKPLCEALEIVRAITGKPMKIISGFRTPTWNKKVKGKVRSQHIEGRAADFTLQGITPKKLFEICDRFQKTGVLPKGGLGCYPTFVHLDIRGSLARW